MARSGAVVAAVHEAVRDAIRPGVTTGHLDDVAAAVVARAGATASFLGYGAAPGRRGFPATICVSVGDEVVHGIPSHDRVLVPGDVVSVDAGAVVEGYHSDSAATWVVGDADPAVSDLVARTRAAMWAGVRAAWVGGRLGDVSAAVEAAAAPHGIVREYVGHGVGRALHEDPQVPNHGRAGRGVRLAAGLVVAIEPMLTLGDPATDVLDDGWTVVTADGTTAAHWEHTVALTPDGPWVLTARSDEPAWPADEPERVPHEGEPWRSSHHVRTVAA